MQNWYNYSVELSHYGYNFTTKNNIVYKVTFVVDHTLNSVSTNFETFDNVYQIVIEKMTDERAPLDVWVSITIKKIIEEFLLNINNAIIYVCSDDEYKAHIRHKVFNRWYNNSKLDGSILKIDSEISYTLQGVNHKLYASLLYHKLNNSSVSIINAFNTINSVLNSVK